MVELNEFDQKLIEEKYNSLLSNITRVIKNSKTEDPLEIYKIICDMLRKGNFSIDGKIEFNIDFDYMTLPNIRNLGSHVMYGVCHSRHASSFVNDVLKLLGYDVSLYYINIDDNKDWHVSTPNQANHITVLLKHDDSFYILDPTNNFILKKEIDNRLTYINPITNLKISNIDLLYNDINEIGSIFKKYYYFKKFGINHIYDYQ